MVPRPYTPYSFTICSSFAWGNIFLRSILKIIKKMSREGGRGRTELFFDVFYLSIVYFTFWHVPTSKNMLFINTSLNSLFKTILFPKDIFLNIWKDTNSVLLFFQRNFSVCVLCSKMHFGAFLFSLLRAPLRKAAKKCFIKAV